MMIKTHSSPPTRTANIKYDSSKVNANYRASIIGALSPPTYLTPLNNSYLSDPECISLRNRLENDTSLINIDETVLQKLLCHLTEYESFQASKAEYSEAKKARGFSEIVRNELYVRANRKQRRGSASYMEIKQNYNNKFFHTIHEYDKETENKRHNILKRHQQTLARLENNWTEEMPRHYRKPSHRLLQLKQIERNMAMSGDYDSASSIHNEVENLLLIEQQQQQQKLINDYRITKQKLIEKQTRELEVFESSRADGRRIIEARHATELNAALNRDIVIQQKHRDAVIQQKQTSYRCTSLPRKVVPKANYWKCKHDTLLPPLLPPNDPQIADEEERKRKEAIRLREEHKKRREEEERRRNEMIQQNILKQQQEYENRQTNQKRNPSVSNIKSKKIDHEIHKSNALSSTLQNPDDTSLKNEKNIESTPIKDSNNNEADSKNDSIIEQNNVVNSEPQFSNDLSKLLNYGNPQPSNAQTKTEISKLEIQEIEINDNYSDDDDDDENNENSVEHDWQPKSQVHTSRMKKVLSQRDSIVFENISFNDIQELNVQPSHSTPIIGHGSNKWSRRYGHYGSGTMSSDHFNFSSHSSMSSCELDREVLSVEPDSDFTLILPFDSFKLSRMQDNSVLSQVPSEIDISQYKTVDLLNDYCGST